MLRKQKRRKEDKIIDTTQDGKDQIKYVDVLDLVAIEVFSATKPQQITIKLLRRTYNNN